MIDKKKLKSLVASNMLRETTSMFVDSVASALGNPYLVGGADRLFEYVDSLKMKSLMESNMATVKEKLALLRKQDFRKFIRRE